MLRPTWLRPLGAALAITLLGLGPLPRANAASRSATRSRVPLDSAAAKRRVTPARVRKRDDGNPPSTVTPRSKPISFIAIWPWS